MTPPTPSLRPHRMTVTAAMLDRARSSVTPFSDAIAAARTAAGDDAIVVAWLGDLHLNAPRPYAALSQSYCDWVDTSANLQLALAELGALEPKPDLVVFGGDLAESGCAHEAPADEYEEMGRILQAHYPAGLDSIAILGNHDHADKPLTAGWHKVFAENALPAWPLSVEQDDFYYATQRGGWRFIGLDSRQGQPLSARQRAWLAAQFAADDQTPTVIVVHRPIVSCGNWVDDFRLQDRATFDVLDGASSVRAVMSGHSHHTAGWTYRGKTHLILPSVAYGIPDPVGWAVVVLSPSGVQAVFTKSLAVDAYHDLVSDTMCESTPSWQQLELPDFERHMLFNVCSLPR